MNCPRLDKYKTLNFKSKSYEEIFLEELNDSFREGLLTDDSKFLDYIQNNQDIENNFVLQSSIHSKQLSKFYDELNNAYDSEDIDKAVGKDLDNIGRLFGLSRTSASSSYVDLTFFNNDNLNYVVIPKGTLVSNKKNGGVFYRTVEEGKIHKRNNNVTIPAISIDKGISSRVGSKELRFIQRNFNSGIDENIGVVNKESSSGGYNRLSDDDFREVILSWFKLLEKGTATAYLDFLNNYDGLNSFSILPCWDGTGTVKIIVDPNSPYLINQLSEDLFNNVQLLDDDVLVMGFDEVRVNVNLTVNITLENSYGRNNEDLDNIKQEIEDLIRVYIDGGIVCENEVVNGLGIGEDFIPFKCGVFINKCLDEVLDITFDDNNVIYVDNDCKAVSGNISINLI